MDITFISAVLPFLLVMLILDPLSTNSETISG
jgi:hypothetical protein